MGINVRYGGPGPQRQELHLYVGSRSVADLDEVLSAQRAGEASVSGLGPPFLGARPARLPSAGPHLGSPDRALAAP